jgi:hypothetical protein
MRAWWANLTPTERAAKIAARDQTKVRDQDRRKQLRRAHHGTPEQRQKIAARRAVHKALRQGVLVVGACERVGPNCDGPIHAHHDDYSKPLDVRWMCRHHHKEHHT